MPLKKSDIGVIRGKMKLKSPFSFRLRFGLFLHVSPLVSWYVLMGEILDEFNFRDSSIIIVTA